MIFDIRELIHTISKAITLQPGDVIATGTPAGSRLNPAEGPLD
jgi:2-keto-4-pentenoate hydratase/2-oxohepta-3-ene-1,7-dioic acid hydratase in catechol pathway